MNTYMERSLPPPLPPRPAKSPAKSRPSLLPITTPSYSHAQAIITTNLPTPPLTQASSSAHPSIYNASLASPPPARSPVSLFFSKIRWPSTPPSSAGTAPPSEYGQKDDDTICLQYLTPPSTPVVLSTSVRCDEQTLLPKPPPSVSIRQSYPTDTKSISSSTNAYLQNQPTPQQQQLEQQYPFQYEKPKNPYHHRHQYSDSLKSIHQGQIHDPLTQSPPHSHFLPQSAFPPRTQSPLHSPQNQHQVHVQLQLPSEQQQQQQQQQETPVPAAVSSLKRNFWLRRAQSYLSVSSLPAADDDQPPTRPPTSGPTTQASFPRSHVLRHAASWAPQTTGDENDSSGSSHGHHTGTTPATSQHASAAHKSSGKLKPLALFRSFTSPLEENSNSASSFLAPPLPPRPPKKKESFAKLKSLTRVTSAISLSSSSPSPLPPSPEVKPASRHPSAFTPESHPKLYTHELDSNDSLLTLMRADTPCGCYDCACAEAAPCPTRVIRPGELCYLCKRHA